MEFLKGIFNGGALTYEQFAEKVGADKSIKLVNLADGGYVGKDKYDALQIKFEAANEQLNTANAKLEGFDPEWKAKAEQAQIAADNRVQQIEFNYALESALGAAKAKNTTAVKALLNMDGLKLADGSIIGLNEQLEKIKAENDYLFESDTPTPRFSASTQGISSNAADKKTQINDMLRSALGGKGDN